MKLNEIRDNKGARTPKTRLGRGIGSGKGKTGGRGGKGQTARSGVSIKGFEGGQMPIYRRLPKRGFNNIFAVKYAEINLGSLQAAVDAGKINPSNEVTYDVLLAASLIRRAKDGVKLLGSGELKSKLTLKVSSASAKAKAAVEAAGGKLMIEKRVVPSSSPDQEVKKPRPVKKTPAKKAPAKKAASKK